MTWSPPDIPRYDRTSRIRYWQSLLLIPDDEPGARMLRGMAAQRLLQLDAITDVEAVALLTESPTSNVLPFRRRA